MYFVLTRILPYRTSQMTVWHIPGFYTLLANYSAQYPPFWAVRTHQIPVGAKGRVFYSKNATHTLSHTLTHPYVATHTHTTHTLAHTHTLTHIHIYTHIHNTHSTHIHTQYTHVTGLHQLCFRCVWWQQPVQRGRVSALCEEAHGLLHQHQGWARCSW
jgi:hypothetical protein